jgi:hypothetical protein
MVLVAYLELSSDGVPHFFFKRCAVTRDLFNMIIELRPSLTSGGLSEHVKRKLSLMSILEEGKKFNAIQSFTF